MAIKRGFVSGNANVSGVANIGKLDFTAPSAGYVLASAIGFCAVNATNNKVEWAYDISSSVNTFLGDSATYDFPNGRVEDIIPVQAQRVIPVNAGPNSVFLNVFTYTNTPALSFCDAELTVIIFNNALLQ